MARRRSCGVGIDEQARTPATSASDELGSRRASPTSRRGRRRRRLRRIRGTSCARDLRPYAELVTPESSRASRRARSDAPPQRSSGTSRGTRGTRGAPRAGTKRRSGAARRGAWWRAESVRVALGRRRLVARRAASAASQPPPRPHLASPAGSSATFSPVPRSRDHRRMFDPRERGPRGRLRRARRAGGARCAAAGRRAGDHTGTTMDRVRRRPGTRRWSWRSSRAARSRRRRCARRPTTPSSGFVWSPRTRCWAAPAASGGRWRRWT